MTVTARTWTTSEDIAAAKLNTIRDDILDLDTRVAAATGPATTWVPVVTQSATITKTIVEARYAVVGKLCAFWVDLSLTSAGTVSNNVVMTLPVTAVGHGANAVIGGGLFIDTSATTTYHVDLQLASTTTVKLMANAGTGGTLGQTLVAAPATTAIAVASGDFLRVSGLYVVA